MVQLTFFLIFCLTFFSSGLYASNLSDFSCDQRPGLADSNILALGLQPGFCQTYGYEAGKAECLHLSKTSYSFKHLSLHGLWPNQSACGSHYGYCGVRQEHNHCDYAALNLSEKVSARLKKIMPNYQYGGCLERHEWNKHGSCQFYPPDDYYDLAMNWVTEVDASIFGDYLREKQGQRVRLTVLLSKIEAAFGSANSGKVSLGCKNKILVDIYIQLPAFLPLDESLKSLMDRASNNKHTNACPAEVLISDFNYQ